MYRLIALNALAALAISFAWWQPGSPSAFAQDANPKDEEGASDQRKANPFNENMTWDEAEKQIALAVEGDEDAIAKVSEGRLAWVSTMEQSGHYGPCLKWQHQLIADDIDWIRSMQHWEVVLSQADGAAILEGWRDREKLFRHPEAQLARAVIACGLLGDQTDLASLTKIKPDSIWVKGALGYIGSYDTARECVDAMQSVLATAIETERYTFSVNPGLLDDDASKYRYRTREYCQLECELLYDASGVMVLHAVPVAWRSRGLIERLGVRISELPTSRDRENAIDKASKVLGPNIAWRALIAGARPTEPKAGEPISGYIGQSSRGPLLRVYAAYNLDGYAMARRWAALACFHGQPDWQVAQRWMLKEAMESGDANYARLCVRAILGLRDDHLDGLVSIASELSSSKLLAQETVAFGEALKLSGDERLAGISKAITGQGEYPNVVDRKPMGLPEKSRAALVAAFSDESEIKAYGGEVALLWMNRAYNLAGHQELYSAYDAFARAVKSAQKQLNRKRGLACSAEAYWALILCAPADKLEKIGASGGSAWEPAREALKREQALRRETPPTDADDKELTRVHLEQAAAAGTELDEDLRDFALKDLSYAGGYGLACLGYCPVEPRNWADRNKMWADAKRAAPLDLQIWLTGLPGSDWFQRYRFMNWFAAEQHTQCAAVLRPYLMDVYARMASVGARAGTPTREVASLILQSGGHALTPYFGGAVIQYFSRTPWARPVLWQVLNRQLASCGQTIHVSWHGQINSTVISVCHGWNMETNWRLVSCGGHRGDYLAMCVDFDLRWRGYTGDVDCLLNAANAVAGMSPEFALRLVSEAEKIGVSKYGYFVASQSYIRAKAQLGEWDEAIKRYRELRGGTVGYPPYLDHLLMYGLLEGNQYEHLDDMFSEFKKYELDFDSPNDQYALRRALMAAGRHANIAKVSVPSANPNTVDGYNFAAYSPLFHEARALLDKGETKTLIERAGDYWGSAIEDGVGVQLDALLLMGLAIKLTPGESDQIDFREGRLHAVRPELAAYFLPTECCLDSYALEILAGEHDPASLPVMDDAHRWHGMVYSERPIGDKGHGFLSDAEGLARDRYVRGVLAFLAEDNDNARTELQACVDLNQRCSYEYHVAEWLLEKQLPKEAQNKKPNEEEEEK